MTEHTPGPWIHMNDAAALRQGILRDGPGAHQLVGKVGRWWILAPRDPHGWSDGDEEADARLIAAAPDLLAACYTALHFAANIDPWWEPSHQQTVATLRAAIAKARGHDAGD